MSTTTDTETMQCTNTWLLVTRVGGSSASRRQRRYRTREDMNRGIESRRKEGATGFWIYGPSPRPTGNRPLERHWVEPLCAANGHRPDDDPVPTVRFGGES